MGCSSRLRSQLVKLSHCSCQQIDCREPPFQHHLRFHPSLAGGVGDNGHVDSVFLEKLLRSSSKADVDASPSGLEAALQTRSAHSLKVVRCIVQAIESQKARNDELSELLSRNASGDGKK